MLSRSDLSYTFSSHVLSHVDMDYDAQRIQDTYGNLYTEIFNYYATQATRLCDTSRFILVSPTNRQRLEKTTPYLVAEPRSQPPRLSYESVSFIISNLKRLPGIEMELEEDPVRRKVEQDIPSRCEVDKRVKYIPEAFLTEDVGQDLAVAWASHEATVRLIEDAYTQGTSSSNGSFWSFFWKFLLFLAVIGGILLLFNYLMTRSKTRSSLPIRRSYERSLEGVGSKVDDIYTMPKQG